MFNIAVILNETELQRYGHANLIPRLSKLLPSSDYSFHPFTCLNIAELFREGENFILGFDALFVSMNACSDRKVYEILLNQREIITTFVKCGKGVFMGYQKKISMKNYDIEGIGFLPEDYEYVSVADTSKDSSEGQISINKDNTNDMLLRYPSTILADKIMYRCHHNDFRPHVYRAYIQPKYPDSYCPILTDYSYEQPRMLLCRSNPLSKERVVVTTIALDWENHEDLLRNIIVYITQGVPLICFISGASQSNNDFDYIVTTAKLSKISFSLYHSIDEIDDYFLDIYNTYIFSPNVESRYIDSFWQIIRNRRKNTKLYSIRQSNNHSDLIMTEYSNCSSVDLMINNVALWLSSQFNGKMWGGGFWITYDTMMMMSALDIAMESYNDSIFDDINKHNLSGSYDGVMGCTLGMYELMFMFGNGDTDRLGSTFNWIWNNINEVSNYEKQSFIAMMRRLRLDSKLKGEQKKIFLNLVDDVFNSIPTYGELSEIELCRAISTYLIKQSPIDDLINQLISIQQSDGSWNDNNRTSYVIIFLLSTLSKNVIMNYNGLDKSIEKGILFLRSSYDEGNGNWNNDILMTVKAVHAIGLHNKVFKYSTKDFFESITKDHAKVDYSGVISASLRKSNELRNHLYTEEREWKQSQSDLEMTKKKLRNQVSWTRKLAISTLFFASMLIALIAYLSTKDGIIADILEHTDSILSMVLGFFATLILETIISMIRSRNDDR